MTKESKFDAKRLEIILKTAASKIRRKVENEIFTVRDEKSG